MLKPLWIENDYKKFDHIVDSVNFLLVFMYSARICTEEPKVFLMHVWSSYIISFWLIFRKLYLRGRKKREFSITHIFDVYHIFIHSSLVLFSPFVFRWIIRWISIQWSTSHLKSTDSVSKLSLSSKNSTWCASISCKARLDKPSGCLWRVL